MTEDQRKYLKNEYQNRYDELSNNQAKRDAEYQEKLENGELTGFDKFCHGLTKCLQRCLDSMMI